MSEYKVILDEREQAVLLEAAQEKDMSPEAVIRHWFRAGQMLDYLQTQGTVQQRILVQQLFDSLNPYPKKMGLGYADISDTNHIGTSLTSPHLKNFRVLYNPNVHDDITVTRVPPATLSCGCEVGCCICNYEVG